MSAARSPQMERRCFQINRTSALSVVGTTNTNVVAFNTTHVLTQGTRFTCSIASQQPAPNSGVWCNVVNDAVFGTTFKFVRKGIYRLDAWFPCQPQVANPIGVNVAITIDCTAASLLAANTLTPITTNIRGERGVLAFNNGTVLDNSITAGSNAPGINIGGVVYITDALAAYTGPTDLPAAAVGAQGIGVVRLHANDNIGGVITSQFINNDITLWCVAENDLNG